MPYSLNPAGVRRSGRARIVLGGGASPAQDQSTVSTAIAHLEADLGVSLFDRSGRYPQLTEAGRQVLAHAQEILAADTRLQQLSVRLVAWSKRG